MDSTLPPSTISYDEEVDSAIKDVLKDPSEFDAPDFDAVAYLNRLFPDQQSLAELDACDADLRMKIAETRHGLVTAVRQQATKSFRAEDDLAYARDAVVALFEFTREVKARADASEEMIERVCRDIRALDDAKKNLHESILILSNLKNLTVQLQTLTDSVKQRKYSRARFDLVACRDLLSKFSAHHHLDRVRVMQQAYQTAADDAEKDILSTYSGLAPMSVAAPPGLSDACLAIDAIGSRSVDRFVRAFVRYQTSTYTTIFGGDVRQPSGRYIPEGEGALARSDKRYTWIKRLLHAVDESYARAFPQAWCLPQELCMELAIETHNHFVVRLPDDPSALPPSDRDAYAADVVRAVRLTLDFERYVTHKFRHSDPAATAAVTAGAGAGGAGGAAGTVTSADMLQTLTLNERMRAKYGPTGAPPAGSAAAAGEGGLSASAAAASNEKTFRFYRVITSAFDLHLEAFVSFEKDRLSSAVAQLIADEKWTVDDPPSGATFVSARDLFVTIHEAYKRATNLTNREPLARMFESWVALVGTYVAALKNTAVGAVVSEAKASSSGGAASVREAAAGAIGGIGGAIGGTAVGAVAGAGAAAVAALGSLTGVGGSGGAHAGSHSDTRSRPVAGGGGDDAGGDGAGAGGDRAVGVGVSAAFTVHDFTQSGMVRVAIAGNTAEFIANSLRTVTAETREAALEHVRRYVTADKELDAIVAATYKIRSGLVACLTASLEKPLSQLGKHKWDAVKDVTEPSAWVTATVKSLSDFFRSVGGVLSATQLRPVCDRAAGSVAAAVLREIYAIKGSISETAAAQLEVDVQALIGSVCDLPEQSSGRDDAPFQIATMSRFNSAQMTAYIRTVKKEFTAVEVLLQCLRLPMNDAFLDSYVGVTGEAASGWHLSRVLELRGVPRARTQALSEAFAAKHGVGGIAAVNGGHGGAAGGPAGGDDDALASAITSIRDKFRGGVGMRDMKGSVLDKMRGSEGVRIASARGGFVHGLGNVFDRDK